MTKVHMLAALIVFGTAILVPWFAWQIGTATEESLQSQQTIEALNDATLSAAR